MPGEGDFDPFGQLRVKAMGDRLREMADDPSCGEMTFEERVKVLLDAEASARRDRKVAKLVREARFRLPSACVEDVLYLQGRKLSKDRVLRWAERSWVEDCEVMVIISKTGCGKSYLSQALGNAARGRLIPTRYVRPADMFDELDRARVIGDGSYYQRMDALKSVQLLILDFMTTPIATQSAVELFEVTGSREGRKATIVASQLEPNECYLRIEGELMADSILNRIATEARYVDLDGPNMREYMAGQRARG